MLIKVERTKVEGGHWQAAMMHAIRFNKTASNDLAIATYIVYQLYGYLVNLLALP
jgi:hypothetical protein